MSVVRDPSAARFRRARASLGRLALFSSALVLGACGGSDGTRLVGVSGPSAPDAEQPAPDERTNETPASNEKPASSAPTNSAILLVGQVYSPESYNTYAGVLPAVPEGDVDFATFREFGNANAYSHGGYVFIEEDGVMQRFSVDENLQLVDGPRFSWQDFGIASINASYTVFVSSLRAYTFAPELGVVVVWNPDAMVRIGTLPVEMPERPADMETFAYDGHLVGDKVIWNMFSGNFETTQAYPAVTLAIADANGDAPVRFVEDPRCMSGGPAWVDGAGNYFVHGGGYYGYFLAYGNADPGARSCILRINAGDSALDPDFVLDYRSLAGSPVSEPWFHVVDNQFVARFWDSSVPYPENPDEFWDNVALRPLLLDTLAGTSAPYPDLAGAKGVDGTNREVDGVSYYQLSQTGYVENGDTDVVELHPDGVVPKFHLNGFLLNLERIR